MAGYSWRRDYEKREQGVLGERRRENLGYLVSVLYMGEGHTSHCASLLTDRLEAVISKTTGS